MARLVAWEASFILLPMDSTSLPIPLMVLQEGSPKAAARMRMANFVFIDDGVMELEVDISYYPSFSSLSMEPWPGNGL